MLLYICVVMQGTCYAFNGLIIPNSTAEVIQQCVSVWGSGVLDVNFSLSPLQNAKPVRQITGPARQITGPGKDHLLSFIEAKYKLVCVWNQLLVGFMLGALILTLFELTVTP